MRFIYFIHIIQVFPFVCVLAWSLLGVKKSLGHAQTGLRWGFNSKFPTSIPTPFICRVSPGLFHRLQLLKSLIFHNLYLKHEKGTPFMRSHPYGLLSFFSRSPLELSSTLFSLSESLISGASNDEIWWASETRGFRTCNSSLIFKFCLGPSSHFLFAFSWN